MSSKDGRLPASPFNGDPATKSAFSDETGRGWLPLKYEDGPDFCTVTFATGAAFALTVHPERMKLMEAALSAASVAQEPVAWQWRYKGPSLAVDDDGWSVWLPIEYSIESFRETFADKIERGTVEYRPLYAGTPPATPAGLGADEIARVFVRWKKSKNLHESLAAQNIEKELLALLSRAGDQSNSTHEA